MSTTGFITTKDHIKERIRLTEFSLLISVLGIETSELVFLSNQAQSGIVSDFESVRSISAKSGKRSERVIAANLPSFQDYFPDSFFVEEMEESDYNPGVYVDKLLEFWSGFDTETYRFWIQFHILKLRLLLYQHDVTTEELYWARFGGETPLLELEERKYLLLLRFLAPYFRGRRAFYEKILPAFIKKGIIVKENIDSLNKVPSEFHNRLGENNSFLGRDLICGEEFTENHTTFEVNVEGMDKSDILEFEPNGKKNKLLSDLMTIYTPTHLSWRVRYNFNPDREMFYPGKKVKTCYLGFSSYLGATP